MHGISLNHLLKYKPRLPPTKNDPWPWSLGETQFYSSPKKQLKEVVSHTILYKYKY